MSRKGSSSGVGSLSSRIMSLFSDDHSINLSSLMLTKTLSEFKKVAKEKKINIKRVEEDGTSLLHWFCSSGKQDIVHYLLSSGVPITKNKTNGQSPLHCAVDCNDQMEDENRANIVQDLVHTEGTGDVDQEDINKWTPLKLACRSGLYQCASYLLGRYAKAEKRDREGNTALHDAVPYPNVTHLVISYVDDLNMKNSDHDTPLILAVKSECEQSVSLLARAGANVNKKNAYGQFPLWLAAQSKNSNIVNILIDAGADLNKQVPEEGTTALHIAAINKTRQICVLLVRAGANVHLRDKKGESALDYIMTLMPDMKEQMKDEANQFRLKRRDADLERVFNCFSMEKFASLEQLLDDVPDVNAQVHGLCFIHMAVVHFQFEAVVLLQRKGADLNVRTHNGDTALHLTCQLREKQTESLRILRFLVSSSVHLDLRNESGETALFLAAGSGLVGHLQYLLDCGANPHLQNNRGLIPLHIACTCTSTHDGLECVQCLLEKDRATVSCPDGDGWTPLMYAAKSGCPEYVKLLLDFGADVNIQEVAKGYTALYLAVMAKSLDVCTILVEAGARIDVRRGMHKITAFHRAAMDDQVEICALFAERGDVCVADGRGNYPLDLVDSPRVRKHLQSLSHRKPRDLPADPLSPVQVAQSGIHATANVPGHVVRVVEAEIHHPPSVSSKDPTPNSIHGRPIQFGDSEKGTNGALCPKDRETVTCSHALQNQGIHRYPEGITDYFCPQQHHLSNDQENDLCDGQVESKASCALENPTSNKIQPTISVEHQSDRFFIDRNISHFVAANQTAISQQVKPIDIQYRDTTRKGRYEARELSHGVKFEKGISVNGPLEERQSKASTVVNRVTSVLPSAAIECHTAYGQEEVNSHEPTVNVIQDGEDDSSNAGFAATGTSRARDVARPQDLFKNRTDDEEHSFDVISEDGDSKNIERSDKEEAMREEQSLEEQEESLAARHVDQPSQEDFRPRWQLEKDEIQTAKLIGSGGFGEVFDGKCRGRQVAIKMMRNRGGPLQDKIMETFFSEVEVMSKLKHEYITEFIGACFDEDLYCIVTELMSKGSVFDLLHQKRTRLSWSRRIAMTNDAAKGMAYLHGLNVLHRDMKSMNLLVNNQWTVKIADFGLTRFKQHTQTMMSSTRGTPAYMAPELLRNQLVSEKIDVYAFGIVMSEIATRAIPFGDQNMNPLQLMFAVCQGTRPNLPSQDKAPRHFLLLARVCWDERPAKRPSFSMIVQELTTLQTNIPSKFS